jgi:hypothetical protein
MRRSFSLVLLIAILALIFPKSADAYLDPGTGSSVLQLALAGFFAASFCLRLGWKRVKSWVGKKRQPSDKPGQEEEK